MRYTLAALGLAASVAATPVPQSGSGCQSSYSGTFEIQVVNQTSSSRKRQTVLTLQLANGILTDQAGRTGYIASNDQFQFDKPPQANALSTSGWSICNGDQLALAGSTTFYQCLSGSFYNLYSKTQGGQCSAIYIEVINSSSGSPAPVSQQSDGQPTGAPVTQITDGQPQATTGVPVTQLSDGQPQGPTGAPVTQLSDGQPQGPTGVPVTQISDGQPQGPTGVPVTQISDGQPQGPTGAPVTQISDGQPQGPTGVPVTQISDGQPQATTGVPVTQISDGQPQAATATPSPVPYSGAGQTAKLGGVAALGAFLAAVIAL